MRINGDGSIRLILNTIGGAGQSKFNENLRNDFEHGYTYNTKPCTKEDPCKSEFNNVATSSTTAFNNTHGGTNSTVKTFLENWYYDNLKNYDKNITYGTFCNDTSYGREDGSSNYMYGAFKRISDDHQPNLMCPNPTDENGTLKNYGGVYKTKIGLITADELNMAGIGSEESKPSTNKNYMYYISTGLTLSPLGSMTLYRNNYNHGALDASFLDSNYYFVPVINLTSDVKVTGNGTSNNPYIVET